ncbi:MAG TPA: hypothetical protein VNE39_20040 [Planctomycetota bacterium]|nr:hypothetical protein [Planctomycetota bacterium]
MKRIPLLLMLLCGVAGADVVVQRWGVAGHVQHPGTLQFKSEGAQGTLLTFDLAALPKGAKVYRARLVFEREGMYGRRFSVLLPWPEDGSLHGPVMSRLHLAYPWHRWFDATRLVANTAQRGDREVRLLLREAPNFRREATFLEIAFEGRLTEKLPQVADLKAISRAGQVFLTFREIEDLSEGKDDYSWGALIKKSKGYNPEMLVPNDAAREIRYRVYRADKPITAKSIGEAELLAEVVPGSRFNTRQVRRIWTGEQTPSLLDEKFVAVRLAVEDGKPLPSGIGKYVHTVARDGKGYYAAVVAINGVENTLDVPCVGPVEEKVAPPEPVMYREVVSEVRDRDKKLQYVQRWYNWYVGPPLSHIPLCYDVVVGFCPERLKKPASLYIHRGHSWIIEPEPVGPRVTDGLDLAHCSDSPNAFWMGINEACHTLKGVEEGKWQPFPQRRQEALIAWLDRQFGLDRERIVVALGAWGMMEFTKPDIYAWVHGWGMPEVTKGFQAWQRACGVWGGVEPYASRPNEENPFWVQDYTRYILENPTKETPFFDIHMGWGAHFTEMGWPPWPRFLRAMIDTKRPFACRWQVRSEKRPAIRRNQSVPAFGNCSLDDNPGVGDLANGETFSAQINGYLNWDSESIVDEPGRWEMTAWLDDSAPLPSCTVDLTPRKCQKFMAKPGETFRWSNATGDKEAQSGAAVADKWGLVTLSGLQVSKAKSRVKIER